MRFNNITIFAAALMGLSLMVGCGEDTLDGLECKEGEKLEDGICVSMCDIPFVYEDGGCVCGPGWELQGDICVPICADGLHPEGTVCLPNCAAGWLWVDGECVRDCPEGLTAVDGECVLVCAEGFEPIDDVCRPICLEGTMRIDGECVALGVIDGSVCNHTLGLWLEGVTAAVTLDDDTELSDATDAEGYFRIEGIPPGVYYVDFTSSTGYSNVLPVAVAAGSVSTIGDRECMPPPGHLKGAVCDQDTGFWVHGATVVLDDANGTLVTTDQFGAFMFFSIPAGDYVITITYPDGTTEIRTAAVFSSQVSDIGPAICEPPPDPCAGDTPVAAAGPDQDAIPDETVQLNGSGSYDPSGQALTFEWRVAGRPIGSTAPLSTSTSPLPTILADVSGDFTICLIVRDSDQCQSPEDCMNIHVAPRVGFHVELVWDTNNTDIDLHMTAPGGSWFDYFDDCYFMNMGPDWGPSGADGIAANNPHLDVDNVVGYGPENINMDTISDGSSYKIGVHYWADHTGGATVSRIRIYVDGQLQFEAFSNTMVDNDFWEVAQVTVTGGGTGVAISPLNTYFVH